MNELHLFAGIGGGILAGMLLGHRCVGAVEIDPWRRLVLRARQAEGLLPAFPIFDDVRHVDGRDWRGVDVIAGGFPCQPWSSAGRRLGAADPRHMWPEMARIVAGAEPRFVFAENSATAAFREPFHDLRDMGYRLAPLLQIGASDVGAPFRRLRCWLLAAHPDGDREPVVTVDAEVARASSAVAQDRREEWSAAPRLRRLVSRATDRVDAHNARISAVGDAQVPAVAAEAFRALMASLR